MVPRLVVRREGKPDEVYDLYRFMKEILGYTKLQDHPHKAWCAEACLPAKRALYLKPRGAYKTTIYTIGHTIFDLMRDPNQAILLVNATSDRAKEFLEEIKGQYTRNDKLIQFHELRFGCKPLGNGHVSADKLVVDSRTAIRKEPSIMVIGAGNNIVSSHYDQIKVDDLCNQEDRESRAYREAKKRWYQNLIAILTEGGKIQVVGTRWAEEDVYQHIADVINPKLPDKDKYLITSEPCWTDEGWGYEPRFPDLLSKETLDLKRIEMGILVFACQEELRPLSAEEQIFKPEKVPMVRHADYNVWECDRYACFDASEGGGDFAALISIARTEDKKLLVFDSDLAHEAQSKSIVKLCDYHEKWEYTKVWIEMNSLGLAKTAWEAGERSNFEILLKQEMDRRDIDVPYVPYWTSKNKQVRISGLEGPWSNKTLVFWDTYLQDYPELVSQFARFPVGHDDGPDATEKLVNAILNEVKPKRIPTFTYAEPVIGGSIPNAW